MGIYRLLLAVAVVLSHIGIFIQGRNPGIVAVVSFFLLSGYVMTALIERHYASLSAVPAFLLDRSMRLFPQFLFYSALTLALIYWFRPLSTFTSELTPWAAVMNLTMLPLNFFRYFPHALTVPQAWSLGLEAQFYLVMPFLLILRLRVLAILLSLAFFLLPVFNVVDPDTWSYRMLPGTLFIFLVGSLLRTGNRRLFVSFIYVVSVVLCGLSATSASIMPPLFEVTLGVVIGVPVVTLLTKLTFGRLDELAGNLSYGMYLNHFFVIWCFQVAGLHQDSMLYVPSLLAMSLTLAWVSYELVEKRVLAMRRSLRNRSYVEVAAGRADAAPPAAS
ncbi:acyltransferase family protein [Burkholderia cenocepacia]|uniref:acyltransferase family protein n=1 Tax=Burkholderia cenocepacia TaxID=95486 RepID=UPI0032C2412E